MIASRHIASPAAGALLSAALLATAFLAPTLLVPACLAQAGSVPPGSDVEAGDAAEVDNVAAVDSAAAVDSVAAVVPATLHLVLTQSTNGELLPCTHCDEYGPGGLARRAVFIDALRSEVDGIVVLDGGDFCLPGATPAPEHDGFLLEQMGAMGYSIVGVGEAELRHGVAALRLMAAKAGVELVCANVVDRESRQPVFSPSRVVTAGPARVAVIGVLAPEIWEPYRDAVEVDVLPIADVLRHEVDRLRDDVDVIVLLGHTNEPALRALVLDVPGIDVALVSHQPRWYQYAQRVSETRLFATSTDGQRIGHARFSIGPDGARFSYGKLKRLIYGLPSDPEVERVVEAFLGRSALH